MPLFNRLALPIFLIALTPGWCEAEVGTGPYSAALDHRSPEVDSPMAAAFTRTRETDPEDSIDRLSDDLQPTSPRAIFAVGSDAACDFATLAEALASAAVGDGDVLHLRSDLNVTGTTTIANRPGTLTLRGGYETCASSTPSSETTFNGSGSRVMYLETTTTYSGDRMVINLEGLRITGGHATGAWGGGGIMINGRPGNIQVNLRAVEVANNTTTQSGGGISVRINGEPVGSFFLTMLTMDNLSRLWFNTANSLGGGLSCFNPGHPTSGTVVRLGTVGVIGNQAENGGGIGVDGCADVFIYPGVSLLGITSNTASANGGGIFVRGDGSNVGVRGTRFDGWGESDNGGYLGGNLAQRGAGIYARDDAEIHLWDIHLVNNNASVEGGAVYAGEGTAFVEIRRTSPSIACRPGAGLTPLERCPVVSGNSGGNAGGAFSARNEARVEVRNTRVFNNDSTVGAIAATSGQEPGTIILENVVAWRNESFYPVVSSNGTIELRWSTFADNVPSDSFMRVQAGTGSEARIRIYGSILRESGQTALQTGSGTNVLSLDCVIGWQDASDFPGTKFFYRNADPRFVDPASRDYRHGPTSIAIDYCDHVPMPPVYDFDGLTRGLEHIGDPIEPGGPDQGLYDIGAFEPRWRTDLMFRDRFKD